MRVILKVSKIHDVLVGISSHFWRSILFKDVQVVSEPHWWIEAEAFHFGKRLLYKNGLLVQLSRAPFQVPVKVSQDIHFNIAIFWPKSNTPPSVHQNWRGFRRHLSTLLEHSKLSKVGQNSTPEHEFLTDNLRKINYFCTFSYIQVMVLCAHQFLEGASCCLLLQGVHEVISIEVGWCRHTCWHT